MSLSNPKSISDDNFRDQLDFINDIPIDAFDQNNGGDQFYEAVLNTLNIELPNSATGAVYFTFSEYKLDNTDFKLDFSQVKGEVFHIKKASNLRQLLQEAWLKYGVNFDRSVWIANLDLGTDGCLYVFLESHKWGLISFKNTSLFKSLLSNGYEINILSNYYISFESDQFLVKFYFNYEPFLLGIEFENQESGSINAKLDANLKKEIVKFLPDLISWDVAPASYRRSMFFIKFDDPEYFHLLPLFIKASDDEFKLPLKSISHLYQSKKLVQCKRSNDPLEVQLFQAINEAENFVYDKDSSITHINEPGEIFGKVPTYELYHVRSNGKKYPSQIYIWSLEVSDSNLICSYTLRQLTEQQIFNWECQAE